MSATNELSDHALRSLAETAADQDTVPSVYVNLDPACFATPRARQSEIDSLLDDAHRQIEAGERSHAALVSLRASLARARELLAPDGDWAAAGWASTASAVPSTANRCSRARTSDDALRAAAGQSAEILALRERPELGPLGDVAATLRF